MGGKHPAVSCCDICHDTHEQPDIETAAHLDTGWGASKAVHSATARVAACIAVAAPALGPGGNRTVAPGT